MLAFADVMNLFPNDSPAWVEGDSPSRASSRASFQSFFLWHLVFLLFGYLFAPRPI